MSRGRLLLTAALVAAYSLLASSPVHAQAVTTGSVSGTVTAESGEPLANTQVQVLNRSTGFSAGVTTGLSGRYTVAGLEVGSNYAITVRRIGFEPQTRDIAISLGAASRADFVLSAQTVVLSGVTVTGERSAIISPTRTGAVTAITDTALRRLPTLNRNFTDFVALTPQVSTTLFNGGLSGGGTNNRYNNVQIDGTSEADVFGLGSTGQPGGQANGKSIGLESVREYVVMLSPYDVRQGFFAGLLINAVSKSGTNEFHGSLFGVQRSEGLTRSQDYITEYEQKQYGFSIGGPIVKNRAFFFFSPEWQRKTQPASGAYLGLEGVALSQATTDAFIAALGQYQGLNTNGTFGLVNLENPLTNIFTRVDVNLPWNSQLVLRHNYGTAEDDNFFRSNSSFRFSDNAYFFNSKKQAPAMQLRTLFKNGAYNEFLAGYTQIRDRRTPISPTAQISVQVPGGYQLVAGAERFSHGNELDQDIFEFTNNFTMPFGSHRITFGTQNQFHKFRNLFAQSTFGVWHFDGMDSLRAGLPDSYIIGVPLQPDGAGGVEAGGDGAVRFKSAIYSLYAQDEWAVTPTLNMTFGLRADVPVFKDKPPTNPAVLESYGFNTADVPSGNLQWSPRVGFNWDLTGDAVNQLRGGVGLFTGRPAYVWLSNMFQNSGMGAVALLTCNGAPTGQTAVRRPPAFTNANIANPPTLCGGGQTAALGGEINVIDPDLKYPQNLRATIGYDRRMFGNWVTTLEGMYTRGVNGLFYENFALAGPQGVNLEGRTVYGLTPGIPVLKPGGRSQIYAVSNQSKDWAYSLTGGIQRRYFNNFEGTLFYTYTRAYDVMSFTSSTSFSQLRYGRPWGENLREKVATRSTFEQRNRIVATAMYTLRTKTDIGVTYFGESGSPYTYIVSGDMNADGFTENDPVYVPNVAAELNFVQATISGVPYSPAQQRAAFDAYVESEPCLRDNRGKILPRNECTAPFTNSVNVKLRQSFRTMRLQHVTLELDIFNFLNLLNEDWGLQRSPGTSPITLLSANSYTGGNAVTGRPSYTFNPRFRRFFSNNLRSNYQMQLQAKYSF
ncbi:MAG: carboxypeptidase regulatory-like domain-containing protein [Gemmatimonadaceae bacterium]|nr:carboxypeptidase regulatory-like domain-containing protein [Gemmatimonadaceae bacterium]